MHLLAAPDKLRGTLTAREAAHALAEGARSAGWTATELPLADGGEGTLDALGGANRTTTVRGPLGDPVDAEWRLDGDAAVIEMARASGLALVQRNDPLTANTRGTGELIAAALDAGATSIVVGVGGSATTDGGLGAVDVLRTYAPLPVEVACDVTTRFDDAAAVFAPQKGATPAQVRELSERLRELAARYADDFGVDVREFPGAGAAGGLAGGLAALGARLVPGFDLIARRVRLADAVAGADLVITAEGAIDETSFAGKVVGGVLAAAASRGVPALACAGIVAPGCEGISLAERFGAERAWADPAGCLRELAAEVTRSREFQRRS